MYIKKRYEINIEKGKEGTRRYNLKVLTALPISVVVYIDTCIL